MTEESSELTSLIGGILELFQIKTEIDPALILGVDSALITGIITATASTIIGISAYFIKRVFSKKDFENQQNIEHSVWLLKKLHEVAVNHYVLLTRHLINAEDEIKKADLSCDSTLIENAYEKISELIRQYDKFQKDTGANILFIERKNENKVIGKISSLFLTLPFDRDDYLRIINKKHELPKTSFINWINSENCLKSKTLVKQRLYELRSLFDDETEKILHHDYFLKSRHAKKIKIFKEKIKKFTKWVKGSPPDSFFIHKISPKYVKKGGKVWLFGSGFKDNSIKYSLKIGNEEPTYSVKDNELVELTLSSSISEGSYDITAQFQIKGNEGNEPMGIVIHVVEQDYLDQRTSLPRPSAVDDELTQSFAQQASSEFSPEDKKDL